MNGHGRWVDAVEFDYDEDQLLHDMQELKQRGFEDYMNDLRIEDQFIDRTLMGQDSGRLEQLSFDFLGC